LSKKLSFIFLNLSKINVDLIFSAILDSDNDLFKEKLNKLNIAIENTPEIDKSTMITHLPDENAWYDSLCRGEIKSNHSTSSKLKCKYITNDNPFLLIRPAKEERVSLNPFIAIYHDVITLNQANILKDFAFPQVNY